MKTRIFRNGILVMAVAFALSIAGPVTISYAKFKLGDLLKDGKRLGFEFKYSDAPHLTKSMHSALTDLSLDRLWVVYPGKNTYQLQDRVEVVPLERLESLA